MSLDGPETALDVGGSHWKRGSGGRLGLKALRNMGNF
jgi:hypothetical protein